MADRITLPDVFVTPDEKPPQAQVAGVLLPGGALSRPDTTIPAHDVQAASRVLGYSWDEIDKNAQDHAAAAANVGYTPQEIDEHQGWPDPAPFHEQQDQTWKDRLQADPSLADALNPGANTDALTGPAMRQDYAQAVIDGHVKDAFDFADVQANTLAQQAGAEPTKDSTARVREIASDVASKLPSPQQATDFSIALTHGAGVPLNPQTIANTKANLLEAWAGSNADLVDIYSSGQIDPDLHRRLVAMTPQNTGAPQGDTPGLLSPGNIDLAARPRVVNKNGSISTVRSMSFEEEGKEVLIPTVAADGSRILTEQEAIKQYHDTGQFLGKFDTPDNATAYAERLHQAQAQFYSQENPSSDEPQILTAEEAQKKFSDRIKVAKADAIEPFSMVGEPVNHGQDFAKFLEEAGVSTIEVTAGGYALGKVFQLGGRTLGYLWSKALELNPEAGAGKAMRPVPFDKPIEPDLALHDAAREAVLPGPPPTHTLMVRGQGMSPQEPGALIRSYEIRSTETGASVADMRVTIRGDTADIDDIRHPGGENLLGPRVVRQLARQFFQENPDVDSIIGFRVSGSRLLEGKGPDGAGVTREQVLGKNGEPPEAAAPLAEGYKAASGLGAWLHNLDPDIVANLQPRMFMAGIFRTPAQQTDRSAFRAGRDFAERSLTKIYGLGTQEIAQFAHDLEPLRRLITPHLKDWEREIAKGPAGAPMDTMIGNLVRYMQGRSVGVTLHPDSPLAPVADMIRTINQAIEAKLRQYEADGKIDLNSYYQDYFRQMWDDPATADRVFAGATRQGSSASFKQRTHPTWEAGLNAGLKPKITDPIELTLYDIGSKIRYLGAVDARDEAVTGGQAYWAKVGSPKNPGDTELAGALAQRTRSYVDAATGKAVSIDERLYAGAGYARSFNNWHGQGMFSHPIGTSIYDNLMYMKNTLTGLKLLNPIFHLRTVGLGSVASGIGQGIEEVGRGQFLRAMGSFAGLVARPITDYYAGAVAHKAFLDKALANPTIQRLVEAGLTFGGRQKIYQMSQAPDLLTSVLRKSLGRELAQDLKQVAGTSDDAIGARIIKGLTTRTLAFGLKEMGRLMTTITHPVFDNIIPHMKAGAAARRLESWLAANPAASEGAVANQTRQIVKDIENREGELNLDAVFWPKMAKQLSNLATISTSWKYGSYRGFMGAMGFDIDRGRWAWNPTVLSSTIGTVLTYGTFNAMEQYLRDGTMPWQTNTPMTDLAFPRTGTLRGGQPVRAMIPSELKEIVDLGTVVAYSFGNPSEVPQAVANYAMGAINPFWQFIRAAATGYNGTDRIEATKGGWPGFLKEALLEPIFMNADEKLRKDSGISRLESFLGDKESPMWAQNWQRYQQMRDRTRASDVHKEQFKANRRQSDINRPPTYDTPQPGTSAAPGGSQGAADAFRRAMQGQQ